MSTDPYRTPAVVEADAQRIQRLRSTYYAMGMCDPRHLPADQRATFEKQYHEAKRRYFDAVSALTTPPHEWRAPGESLLQILGLASPSTLGAGSGET